MVTYQLNFPLELLTILMTQIIPHSIITLHCKLFWVLNKEQSWGR